MIHWEEIKHMHVIRKLMSVLGDWFHIDLLFVDSRGQIQELENSQKNRIKNRFLSQVVNKTLSFEKLGGFATFTMESLSKSSTQSVLLEGPFGAEYVVASKITVDGDLLGAVIAMPFLKQPLSESVTKEALSRAKILDLDVKEFETALNELKVAGGKDLDYLRQLVDLVAQEVITYQTEIATRQARIEALNQELGSRYRYDNMIGKSKPMQELYGLLDKIKSSESSVLIQGENGTGKELIAKAIHYSSSRKEKAFVTVNCSAFNENLLDSELFGHTKGSFTGAIKDKKGLFEVADHGTLFLDEIGDMSPAMQVKLLRVLQEGTLTPVGGTETIRVDVRVLAATNRDLKAMIEDGTFREDLYYRVNVINVYVPSLKERKEDIPLLVDFFMARGCKEKNLPMKQMAKRTMEKIYDYAWPGNIRELENEIERLLVLSADDTKIPAEMLSARIRDWGEKNKIQGVRVAGRLKDALEELEKTMIREGLKRTNWNKSKLAKELGISRAGLIMKVDKYGLDKRKLLKAQQEAAQNGGSIVDEDEVEEDLNFEEAV